MSLRPSPKFNITYEAFKSGEYIIGGVVKVSITGEIYGSSSLDLTSKIQNISTYSGTCRPLRISCNGSELINGQAFIKSVSFNPADQPFLVNYTIEAELSSNKSAPAIKKDTAFEDLYNIAIPTEINLKSYEESLAFASDESMANTAIYSGDSYTKASLKINGNISIQAYHHMCDSGLDIIDMLYDIVNSRISNMLSLDTSLSTAYPSLSTYTDGNYSAINDTKNITINKFDNKIDVSFDIYVIGGVCHPKSIVDLTISENTDQTTGLSTWGVRGSIRGLADPSTSLLDNNVQSSTKLENARLTYNDLRNQTSSPEYLHKVITGCGSAASPPSDICYQRISSQITENLNGGQIDFDMSYGDVESCQIGGTTIDINIQEELPTNKYIEHIIPGRGEALIQIGANLTPFKATVTASGKLNTCDTSKIGTLISCVNAALSRAANNNNYNSYILAKESKTIGKYSYKVTRNYIECPS